MAMAAIGAIPVPGTGSSWQGTDYDSTYVPILGGRFRCWGEAQHRKRPDVEDSRWVAEVFFVSRCLRNMGCGGVLCVDTLWFAEVFFVSARGLGVQKRVWGFKNR